MSNTRKPMIWLATFVFIDRGVVFRCPKCNAPIGVGLKPYHTDGYSVDDTTGDVHPIFVCSNVKGEKRCMFEGHIRLTMQVKDFDALVTEAEDENDLA